MLIRFPPMRTACTQHSFHCHGHHHPVRARTCRTRAGIDDLGAVVSTVGGTTENPQADGEGNINIINAAAEAGVKKFVLVTSIGTGDSKDAPGEQVYNVLKPVLLEKEKAEAALKVCRTRAARAS